MIAATISRMQIIMPHHACTASLDCHAASPITFIILKYYKNRREAPRFHFQKLHDALAWHFQAALGVADGREGQALMEHIMPPIAIAIEKRTSFRCHLLYFMPFIV